MREEKIRAQFISYAIFGNEVRLDTDVFLLGIDEDEWGANFLKSDLCMNMILSLDRLQLSYME